MKSLVDILAELQRRPDCQFLPAAGLPSIPSDLRLPPDLTEFYGRHSEARLFIDTGNESRCHILPPDGFVQVGEAIMGEPTTRGVERSWYALAHVLDSNYIGIDLLPDRLGRCYDCFHETYGMRGYCQVVALSFTEFPNRLADAGGKAFWLKENFVEYGEAYEMP